MKRFITAILLALTVIVCEQQTLFAPHYKDYTSLTAANPGEIGVANLYEGSTLPGSVLPCQSSVPVAGALRDQGYFTGMVGKWHNSSLPVAGSNDNGFQRYPPLVKPTVDFVYDCRPNIVDLDDSRQVVGPNDGPSVIDDMPFQELDSRNGPVFFSHHANIDYLRD